MSEAPIITRAEKCKRIVVSVPWLYSADRDRLYKILGMEYPQDGFIKNLIFSSDEVLETLFDFCLAHAHGLPAMTIHQLYGRKLPNV